MFYSSEVTTIYLKSQEEIDKYSTKASEIPYDLTFKLKNTN